MADSIRELILQNLESAIKNVKTTNGYNNNIPDENVKRGKVVPVDIREGIPGVFIYVDDDPVVNRELGINIKTHRELKVLLEVWQTSAEVDLPAKINEIEAEVIKAVMVDRKRGGYAIDTALENSEAFYLEGEKRVGGMIITVVISYYHKEANPFER